MLNLKAGGIRQAIEDEAYYLQELLRSLGEDGRFLFDIIKSKDDRVIQLSTDPDVIYKLRWEWNPRSKREYLNIYRNKQGPILGGLEVLNELKKMNTQFSEWINRPRRPVGIIRNNILMYNASL